MTDTSTTRDSQTDDAELIARVLAGDRDAYEPLVLRYQDRIFSVVRRMVANREDARDLTQDAFVSAYRALDAFRSESSFHTWLFRIAANTVISFRRKRRPVAVVSIGANDLDAAPDAAVDPPDSRPGPAEAAEASERRQTVLAAVGRLVPEFRDAIALRDFQGCSYGEMADILGCPVGTVKSRIHRARLALREQLVPIFGGAE